MTVWLIVFGFISGILGGMGMGGGTLLIPLLNFLDIEQQTIQAINLISFLPMACVALGLHFKNKLVKPRHTLWMIAPACAFCILGRAAYQKHVFRGIENLLRRVYAPAGRVAVDFVRKTDGKGKKDRQGKVAFFRYGKLSFKPPTRAGALSTSRIVHSRTSAVFGRSDRGEKIGEKSVLTIYIYFFMCYYETYS